MVQPVFDGPMCAIERQQALGISFFCRQTGDQIGDFDAVASVHAAMTFDARDLRRARPIEVRSDFRTDRDLADFDAAVRLFDGFGARKIRRQGVVAQAVGGKDRRTLRRCCLSVRADCP